MSDNCQQNATGNCVSVVPSEICLRLVKDADTTFEFILTDGKCEPVNITNDDVKLTVRETPGGTLKIQKTNASGSHSEPLQGKTQFTIAHDDITEAMEVGQLVWVYEIRRIQSGGEEAVHIQGDFIVDRSVGG